MKSEDLQGNQEKEDMIDDAESVVAVEGFGIDDVEEEEIDYDDTEQFEEYDILERKILPLSQRGYKTVTKHKIVLNKSKNGYRPLSFPPAFQMNKRRISSKSVNKFHVDLEHRKNKKHASNEKTEEPVIRGSKIDSYSQHIIYRMIDKDILKKVNNVISTGKIAVIFHAEGNPLFRNVPKKLLNPPTKECIIKVFQMKFSELGHHKSKKDSICLAKNFAGKETLKVTTHLWGEKEISSLERLGNTTIHCPQLITHKNHIVVMSFIGEQGRPALKIRDIKFTTEESINVYKEIVEAMRTMYKKARVIHGNLSENNILWHNKNCYFVDFSQSLHPSDKNAFESLLADCSRIINFFTRQRVPNISTAHEIFMYITGCDFSDKLALTRLTASFQNKSALILKD